MTDKQIIIDGVNVRECECFYINDSHPERKECINPYCKGLCKDNPNCCFKQLKRKEKECEELHSRTASIIYSLTGGRLSYSTYTLEGCEQAYHDQLEIDVERATKELQEELKAKEQECKSLEEEIRGCRIGIKNISIENTEICKISEKYKQALAEIKEICNSVENIENINSLYDAKLSGMFLQANKILQKISECKGEYNEKIR